MHKNTLIIKSLLDPMALYIRFVVCLIFSLPLVAQDAGSIYRDLERLNFLGSVLYIAAHPDDENTALIAHFSKTEHAHTGYLSLTRGDGGQNLIGTELREQLGVIRTNELLQARKIDGGEQFFTTAIDFGYSKNPKETLGIWEKEQLLGEVVKRIRTFQPDIIIHRFDHRTPGRTHGHHTTSAVLGHEAFTLANDPNAYAEQLKTLSTWSPRRQFFNTSWWFYGSQANFEKADKTNLLALEIGQFDALTGQSNGEVAAQSRSQHKSQGFGSAPRLGKRTEYIELINGDRPKGNDPFEGINTQWSRLDGGEKVGTMITQALAEFDFTRPAKSVPALQKIYSAIEALSPSVWRDRKLQAAKELLLRAAGITLQLNAERPYGVPGEDVQITLNSLQQSDGTVEIVEINQSPLALPLLKNTRTDAEITLPLPTTLSTPYWLTQKGSLGRFKVMNGSLAGLPATPPLSLDVRLTINGEEITYTLPVQYRTTDPVRGEVVTPFYVLPPVSVKMEQQVHLFADKDPQKVRVEVTNYGAAFDGTVELCFPNGWAVDQPKKHLTLDRRGAAQFIEYTLRPLENATAGLIGPLVHQGEQTLDKVFAVSTIAYDHIPKQYVAQPSEAKVVPLQLTLPQKKIGYLMGAGDLVADQLRTIGLPITDIDITTIAQSELNKFDVILVGIRAFNVLPELAFKNKMLFDFAQQGGTLIVQYNTSRGLKTKEILPYEMTLSRDRVTDEASEVRFTQPTHPALTTPHRLNQQDFDGWVQERGLYFANAWSPALTPLLGMNDEGESEKKGALLIGDYGEGKVVYTGISFFRELPAGVPGAYRLLINLIDL